MPIPFTRAQAVQNGVFLRCLFETGNVRLSAREAGVKYGTIQHRRSVHAGFAQDWDAAIAAAHARFHLGGPPSAACLRQPLRTGSRPRQARSAQDEWGLRTTGADPFLLVGAFNAMKPVCFVQEGRVADELPGVVTRWAYSAVTPETYRRLSGLPVDGAWADDRDEIAEALKKVTVTKPISIVPAVELTPEDRRSPAIVKECSNDRLTGQNFEVRRQYNRP
jgi:hypothetical protein